MSEIKNISLFIPYVFPNFDKEYVAKSFKRIGEVSQVDFIAKQDRYGDNYNAVYVHFKKWHSNPTAAAFYDSLFDKTKEARLCHDENRLWYWIVLPNTAKKHVPGDRKPRLDLGESNAISASNTVPVNEAPATPVKAAPAPKLCPEAPMKLSYAETIAKQTADANKSLKITFDDVAAFEAEFVAEYEAEMAEMGEIEDFLEEEDENLVTIDGRYVQAIEEENWNMRAEITQLRAALINMDIKYQAEAAKVRAFSSVDL